MRCSVCNQPFDFAKAGGISYRNRPICEECLMNLTFIFLDMKRDALKRYLGKEVKLKYYDQR